MVSEFFLYETGVYKHTAHIAYLDKITLHCLMFSQTHPELEIWVVFIIA